MDCVTARYGLQVQPTKMTLARQRNLSSSEVRASDLEHGGSWVRIPSGRGSDFFLCPLMIDSLHLPLFPLLYYYQWHRLIVNIKHLINVWFGRRQLICFQES